MRLLSNIQQEPSRKNYQDPEFLLELQEPSDQEPSDPEEPSEFLLELKEPSEKTKPDVPFSFWYNFHDDHASNKRGDETKAVIDTH